VIGIIFIYIKLQIHINMAPSHFDHYGRCYITSVVALLLWGIWGSVWITDGCNQSVLNNCNFNYRKEQCRITHYNIIGMATSNSMNVAVVANCLLNNNSTCSINIKSYSDPSDAIVFVDTQLVNTTRSVYVSNDYKVCQPQLATDIGNAIVGFMFLVMCGGFLVIMWTGVLIFFRRPSDTKIVVNV
jgi:uncharacterized membrane protein